MTDRRAAARRHHARVAAVPRRRERPATHQRDKLTPFHVRHVILLKRPEAVALGMRLHQSGDELPGNRRRASSAPATSRAGQAVLPQESVRAMLE